MICYSIQQAEFFFSSNGIKRELQKHGATIWFMNQFKYRIQQLVMHVDFLPGTISNQLKGFYIIGYVLLLQAHVVQEHKRTIVLYYAFGVLWVVNNLLRGGYKIPTMYFCYLHSTALMNSCATV